MFRSDSRTWSICDLVIRLGTAARYPARGVADTC